jgi:hypothetical protein
MRRIASIGIMLLALAGCQSLPALVRIEVDGATLEFKKKAAPPPDLPAPETNSGADAPAP